MKKIFLIMFILLSMIVVISCSNNNQPAQPVGGEDRNFADFTKYQGDWKLKVDENTELYLITSFDPLIGSTGIEISEVDGTKVKGSIHSIQGAPSYRQAIVDFSGQIEEGVLQTTYKDESWDYSGSMELTFGQEEISARITRDKADMPAMWGIPEGNFAFIRPIQTEEVEISVQEKESLEEFLLPTAQDRLEAFAEGSLSDEMMIQFAGVNLALGFIDPKEYAVEEAAAELIIDESAVDLITKKYFGVEVKQHKTSDIMIYKDGEYTIQALGGVTEQPVVKLLLQDTEKEGDYYALVDYLFEYPDTGTELVYQRLIKLHKDQDYVIAAITQLESPLELSLMDKAELEAGPESVESALSGNEPPKKNYAMINSGKLEFDQGIKDYFGGDVDAALDQIQPLLVSAAYAAHETQTELFLMGNHPRDPKFEWTMIYHLINNYEFERDGVSQEGGSIVVPAEVMMQFFGDAFYTTEIYEVPENLSQLITYDQSNGSYSLLSASGGGIQYELRDIGLGRKYSAADSSESATITIDVKSAIDRSLLDTVCVEVYHALSSTYYYSVLSVHPAD